VLLAPVLWSAADLLIGGEHRRIRQCANAQCLWLFVDASKSGTRRWCDMASCGNRAKARRHYLRTKRS
jgi:predicted RNA-binding Zn ribbon-like protein